MMIDFKNIFGLLACLLFASIGSAQTPAELPAKFDLVIFGNNLDFTTEVFLNENPGIEAKWHKLDSAHVISDEEDEFTSLLFSSLSTKKFAGQDIRENYIAVKISSVVDSIQHIQALYAFPHINYSSNKLQAIHTAIHTEPKRMRKFSLGTLIFPRPQLISGQNGFTEHVEMPVRHLKPGVQEVKWLDIIFRE